MSFDFCANSEDDIPLPTVSTSGWLYFIYKNEQEKEIKTELVLIWINNDNNDDNNMTNK